MSVALLFVCRRSISSVSLFPLRPALLRPLRFSPLPLTANASNLRSKYGSMNPGTSQNPFQEPADERSRRMKMQQQIRFREKFQLTSDYELIFALPRERMYGLLHLLCTCAGVTMLVFVAMQLYRDSLDVEPVQTDVYQDVQPWIFIAVAAVIGSMFGAVLFLITRIPTRLYHSPTRQAYALFYYPFLGVFRQKKIMFDTNQYQIIPQKLDSIESAERSFKIRIEIGKGLSRLRQSFYLIENYFRSKRDLNRMKLKTSEHDATTNEDDKSQEEQDGGIWETVVEQKDKPNPQQRAKKFFR